MAYNDYVAEVMGAVPRIDIFLAQKLVQRSWSDIRRARLWSWQRAYGVLVAPQIITSGTISTTQFSNTVTLDPVANAALNNLTNPLITLRQIRFGLGGGPVYSINAYSNNSATITLDRPYGEATAVGQAYQCYRCYYSPCDINGNYTKDFWMYSVVLNPTDGYAIVGNNLRLTQQELDARDPTRGAQDLAYTMATRSSDANGMPIFEMWPHPTSAQVYLTMYRKRGMDLSQTQDIPPSISPKLVVEGAFDHAYQWAITNAGRFPELKGVDWALAKAENKRMYDHSLKTEMLEDDNLATENYLPQLRDYLQVPPIDSDFMQSHDLSDWGI